jgi:DnaJ-domain-containing protein 1
MLYLIGGFLVLGGFLLLVRLFVNADPARLARNLKWAGIALGGVAVVGFVLLPPVRELVPFLLPLALSMPMLARLRRLYDRYRAPAGGRTSDAQTEFLRMSLDHDTGAMSGTVLRGRFSGMRIEELGLSDLLALLRECRAEDDQAARLVEAYLDRVHPDWRAAMAGGGARGGGARDGGARGGGAGGGGAGGGGAGGGAMSVEEACAILGIASGASPQEIKEAHHRLMQKLHPDHGGSDYLAMQINRARDVLLRGR